MHGVVIELESIHKVEHFVPTGSYVLFFTKGKLIWHYDYQTVVIKCFNRVFDLVHQNDIEPLIECMNKNNKEIMDSYREWVKTC